MLIPLIYKHGISLVSFIKFIPRYFLVFEVIINGIVSLISFSFCALLVYRKTIDFCMLILYSATLPKEFMISSSFLVEFLGSLRIGSCHLQIGIVWFLPSLLESLLFLALVLLFWLGFPKLYLVGVEKEREGGREGDSPLSFLNLRGNSFGCSPLV
jgi:hypothetical protein